MKKARERVGKINMQMKIQKSVFYNLSEILGNNEFHYIYNLDFYLAFPTLFSKVSKQ